MSNRSDIAAITKKARKVHASVSKRRPAHWSGAQAARLTHLMKYVVDYSEMAFEYCAQLEEANGKPKPVLAHSTGVSR